jgi:hypothetical protein
MFLAGNLALKNPCAKTRTSHNNLEEEEDAAAGL